MKLVALLIVVVGFIVLVWLWHLIFSLLTPSRSRWEPDMLPMRAGGKRVVIRRGEESITVKELCPPQTEIEMIEHQVELEEAMRAAEEEARIANRERS